MAREFSICVFSQSIIGNTASERPTDRPSDRATERSTDRQNLPRIGYVPTFIPAFTTFHHGPPFVADPINSYHIQDTFSARNLAGDTLSNRRWRTVDMTLVGAVLDVESRFRYRILSSVCTYVPPVHIAYRFHNNYIVVIYYRNRDY